MKNKTYHTIGTAAQSNLKVLSTTQTILQSTFCFQYNFPYSWYKFILKDVIIAVIIF